MGCNKSKIPDAEFDSVPPQGGGQGGGDRQERTQSHDKRMSAVLRSKRAGGRANIMGEKMDMNEAYTAKKIYKAPEVEKMISNVLSNTFPFSSLEPQFLKVVVDAMENKQVVGSEQVITQGEQGDYFYLVESGNFTVVVNNMEVGTVSQGGTFGELALMHGAPRAATIRCNSNSASLWQLDRNTFRRTLASTTETEIHGTVGTLQRVPQFEKLTEFQLNKMAEAVEPVSFNAGDLIIEKGTAGSVFYIVKKGSVICKDIGTEQRPLEVLIVFGMF
jgi:CRP-like cAMP-binding protein